MKLELAKSISLVVLIFGSINCYAEQDNGQFDNSFKAAANEQLKIITGIEETPQITTTIYDPQRFYNPRTPFSDKFVTKKLKTGMAGYLSTAFEVSWRMTVPNYHHSAMVNQGGLYSSAHNKIGTRLNTTVCEYSNHNSCLTHTTRLMRSAVLQYPQRAPTLLWLNDGKEWIGLKPNTLYEISYRVITSSIRLTSTVYTAKSVELSA